jgi:hypothetical protein
VVPGFDRLQERVEVGGLPRFRGRGHQDDRLIAVGQPVFERPGPTGRVGTDDEGVRLPLPGLEHVEQATADRLRLGPILGRHHDHQDIPVRDRLAFGGSIERVNPVIFRQRGLGLRERPHLRVARSRISNREISDLGGGMVDIKCLETSIWDLKS